MINNYKSQVNGRLHMEGHPNIDSRMWCIHCNEVYTACFAWNHKMHKSVMTWNHGLCVILPLCVRLTSVCGLQLTSSLTVIQTSTTRGVLSNISYLKEATSFAFVRIRFPTAQSYNCLKRKGPQATRGPWDEPQKHGSKPSRPRCARQIKSSKGRATPAGSKYWGLLRYPSDGWKRPGGS
jgi:hypothetical protein